MLPEGRVYSKTVEDHAEEDKLISLAPTPAKKIDRKFLFQLDNYRI
jgi:hypothetical protein